MDFQLVILFVYMSGIATAIWFLQFSDCIRRFEQSRLNPIPQRMVNQYHDSKKHDISTEEQEQEQEQEQEADTEYEADSEYDYEESEKEMLEEYLQRYPKVYIRYLQADTQEARQAILDELRHCENCAGENKDCEHNDAEVNPGIVPFDLPPHPLATEELTAGQD